MKYVLFFALVILVRPAGAAAQAEKSVYQDSTFIANVLQEHNTFRSALHIPPLAWSPSLANDALGWATELAKGDQGRHDSRLHSLHEGENIWWGTAGGYSYTNMVDAWGDEKKDFVYGVFPDCIDSKSAVVGHYTQMIWSTTTTVGCALVSNGKTDFLVCRYAPPGNYIGQKPY
jgi:uncharacterized protein YkwD